ncbi:citrinin biosynthesis oxidoreductase CtnB [Metarhizium album ARSEF 1941]|uniref:Citrinin biosynthesis oxydoreductase CtnB n=1 Tax=Metarhizium album (strain ARSEF 1941) TaxID=1081103 RepID=A0A0B2WHN3_METAS|nr:citrinin biosynthesis oxidoreductase CtnB [Metarhizium album ARSEF 1941]KHN95526.1 citrinin biosynthesis oxydoreductase CtnB [Metarhizium album ARSEF 1941]
MTVDDTLTLTLPRILCLHGGGVNGTVFRLQCRTIIAQLARTFRLVFMDAPYASRPHRDIAAVYGELGPFYRWLAWSPEEPGLPPSAGPDDIMDACLAAMARDAGSGPWVGVLGFSQGAKVAASLLWAQQRAEADAQTLPPRTSFKFGVLMAGSAPVLHLDRRLPRPPHVASTAVFSTSFDDYPDPAAPARGPHVLRVPTLHVHGLQDPGLPRHRALLHTYCEPGTTRLVEWHAGHRLPIKTADVQAIVAQLLDMATETGALPRS